RNYGVNHSVIGSGYFYRCPHSLTVSHHSDGENREPIQPVATFVVIKADGLLIAQIHHEEIKITVPVHVKKVRAASILKGIHSQTECLIGEAAVAIIDKETLAFASIP